MASDSDLHKALLGLGQFRIVGRDPVNLPHVRSWCDAFDDANPLYLDSEAAVRAGLDGPVAPLVMLGTWATVPLRQDPANPHWRNIVRDIFSRHGYDAVIATNMEFEFERYLRMGDQITAIEEVEEVSGLKTTGVGQGYFLTSKHSYVDEKGETVGQIRIRVLHFASPPVAERPAATPAPKAAPALPAADPAIRLQPVNIAITPTLVVSTALATGDFEPVHHDYALARSQGLQDIITNIPSTSGLLTKYITDQIPGAFIRSLKLRLGAPNFPGDHLQLQTTEMNGGAATIIGRNSIGEHVRAQVVLENIG